MAVSETVVILITVLYAITMFVAIVGNGLLIYFLWKKPDVRSLTSSMFINKAVADIMVAFVTMPVSIAHVHTGGQWMITGVLGDVTCRASILIAYATLMASILCLTFMAIDRFYAVVCPRNIWFRKAKFVTPLVWVMSIALMAIMPVFYKLNLEYSFCEFHILETQTKTFRGIFLYIFVITYVIPLAVMSPLCAKIACKIWFNQANNNPLGRNQQRQQEVTERKEVRMLIIIVMVFALCWLPGQAIHLFWAITAFYIPTPAIAMYLGFWLGHANSAINPWLYISLSTEIRSAFVGMVTRKSKGRPRQSTQKTSSAETTTNDGMHDTTSL